jgi:hypothetical protein
MHCIPLLDAWNNNKRSMLNQILSNYALTKRDNIQFDIKDMPYQFVMSNDKITDTVPGYILPPQKNYIKINVKEPVIIHPGRTEEIKATLKALAPTTSFLQINNSEFNKGINFDFDPKTAFVSKNLTMDMKLLITSLDNITTGMKVGKISFHQIFPNGQSNPNPIFQNIMLDVVPRDIFKENTEKIKNFELTYLAPFFLSLPFVLLIHKRIIKANEKKQIDVLPVDATLITGVLIFITFGGIFSSSSLDEPSPILEKLPIMLTASIVIPFAISALLYTIDTKGNLGVLFMWVGFVYLIISVTIIAIVKQ